LPESETLLSARPAVESLSRQFFESDKALARRICASLELHHRVFDLPNRRPFTKPKVTQEGNTMKRRLAAPFVLFCLAALCGPVAAQTGTVVPDTMVPSSPQDGGPRHFEVTGVSSGLNLREEPSTSARVILTYPSGTILANLGCRRAGGGVWCDVQKLGGGARGFVSARFLKPAVAPDGSVPTGPDDSALRAGRGEFDATGRVACARDRGQPMTRCEFGVARAGGGYATVVVTRPDGLKRGIYFTRGELLGADTSQADGYPPVSASKQSDLYLISVGEERYEIPDAVIFGG
jgi:hypothetical protein